MVGTLEFDPEQPFSRAVANAFATGLSKLLVLTADVELPTGALDFAGAWMDDDPRIATVSFLNRDLLNVDVEESAAVVTAKLRRVPSCGRVHIAIPSGGAVLISHSAFLLAGLRPDFDDDPELATADFALRAARRGLFTLLDAHTFVMHRAGAIPRTPDYSRLHPEHPFFPALYDEQRTSSDGPLELALDYARASYRGLRILIDGSCLGPIEMGTQVQTVATAKALAQHPNVQWIGVALPGKTVPPYAVSFLSHEKIRLYADAGEQFSGVDQADILHRPFQPSGVLPFEQWRGLAKRVLLTVLDLIVYRIGAYVSSPERWIQYRRDFAEVLRRVDGAIAISKDVRQSIEEEKLQTSGERLFVAPLGTDHLAADAEAAMPAAIREKHWDATRFALVLGTDYTHKNRDIAVRTCSLLKNRGYDLRLVLAGAAIPFGSGRSEEAMAGLAAEHVLVLSDVTPAERNWLLREAALVLYPTSGEGFGLVPFEAAVFGTPTVAVSFGPVREFDGPAPLATQWDPEQLANIAQSFLDDPAAARSAVEHTLDRGAELTWANTADALVKSYFKVLRMPPVETREQIVTARLQVEGLVNSRMTSVQLAGRLDRAMFLLRSLSASRAINVMSRFSRRLRSALRQARALLEIS